MHCLCSYYTQSLYKEVIMESGWRIVATHAENELQVKDDLVGPKNKLRVCAVLMYAVKHTHTGWFVLNECLMFKESTVLVDIFITAPFGKPPFSFCFLLVFMLIVFCLLFNVGCVGA